MIMDVFDCYPSQGDSRLIEGSPARYSVGYFRGRHRVTIAYHVSLDAAMRHCRALTDFYSSRPIPLRFDVSHTLF